MNNIYRIPCPKTFNLSLCLDGGHAFRWTNNGKIWQGVAYGKYIENEQTEREIIIYNSTKTTYGLNQTIGCFHFYNIKMKMHCVHIYTTVFIAMPVNNIANGIHT